MGDFGHWTWGPAWNKLRNDVNILIWLWAEREFKEQQNAGAET